MNTHTMAQAKRDFQMGYLTKWRIERVPMGDGWISIEQAALQGAGLDAWLEPALSFHTAQGAQ